MAYGTSSGTTTFNPFASDLVLDALERCEIYAPETRHLTSARQSLNLLLTSSWANRGINLWRVQLLVTPLIQGVPTYNLTSDIISVLDTYRRQYQMNAPVNVAIDFSTVINTPVVTVVMANSGATVGGYVQIALQVSVGGLILYGFYQITSTPTANSFTFNAAANATGTVNHGGTVPAFTTTNGSATVSVLLANHGLLAGQPFNVPVSTTVGGITVSGSYSVLTVTDANNFTIGVTASATSGQTVTENTALASIATQSTTALPTDILMTPISRNDYAGQSNKLAPGAPTTLWVNRQIIPQVSLWPVTDGTGPYEMRSYVFKQIEDVNPTGGQTIGIVQRAFYACTLDLARDLSMKFAAKKYAMLKQEAMEAWADMSSEDVEHTSSYIIPSFARP